MKSVVKTSSSVANVDSHVNVKSILSSWGQSEMTVWKKKNVLTSFLKIYSVLSIQHSFTTATVNQQINRRETLKYTNFTAATKPALHNFSTKTDKHSDGTRQRRPGSHVTHFRRLALISSVTNPSILQSVAVVIVIKTEPVARICPIH